MELISKREVLSILNDMCNHALKVYDKKYHIPIRLVILTMAEDIKILPTTESRAEGEWKAKGFQKCYCDNCGFSFDIMKCDFIENMKHCPECGTEMRRKK